VKNNLIPFLLALFAVLHSVNGQTQIDWTTLADVKFTQKFSEETGLNYDEATFGRWLLPFNGKEVKISGYIIPLDGMGVTYVLSRNPNANCFFCGGAGPETVIELRLKPSALNRYKLDDRKTFKGILQMNRSNLNQMTYVLLDAEPI
jgi:hypothetical protein